MKLTDGEKLIILMLTEMYEKLQIEGETEPDFLRSAIFNDHLWGIRWKYSGIPFEQAEDPPIVREVVDILDMWSFIEYAYAKLSEQERQQLALAAKPFGENPRFNGFDGNNECEYISIARFLIDQLDRFTRFHGRDLNSHMPSVSGYRRMYETFEPIRRTLIDRRLTVEELAQILNARRYRSGE